MGADSGCPKGLMKSTKNYWGEPEPAGAANIWAGIGLSFSRFLLVPVLAVQEDPRQAQEARGAGQKDPRAAKILGLWLAPERPWFY